MKNTGKILLQKEYLLYLPDGSSENENWRRKKAGQRNYMLVQAELDYLYEKELEKKITLKNIYITEDESIYFTMKNRAKV